MAFDDRPPAAGAFDSDIIDDDVPVHLERAGRDVDRLPCGFRRLNRAIECIRGVAHAARVGAEVGHGDRTLRTRRGIGDLLQVDEVDDRPRRICIGGPIEAGALSPPVAAVWNYTRALPATTMA